MPINRRTESAAGQLDAVEIVSDLNTVVAEPQGTRDYALDAARAVLMVLGVVLHSASAYSASSGWVIRDPENSVVLDWLLRGIHLFRMPAFFWISGYFFALTMSRGDRRVVLRRRFFRLLVPIIVTWLTFNVAQEWVVAAAHGQDPVQAIVRGGVPVYHLWFLIDLFVMSLVAAIAFAVPEVVVEQVRRSLPEAGNVAGVLLMLTALWFVTVSLARLTGLAYAYLGGITTLGRIAFYLPFFAVGIAMYHLPGIRRTFLRVPPVLALFAIPLGVYLNGFRRVHGFVAELAAPAEQLMAWICVAVVLQLFYRFIRRESRMATTMSDASYSIYLFHHFLMVVCVLLLMPLSLGALPKFFLASIIVFGIAATLHLALVRRSRVLRLLFNGKWAGPATARRSTPHGLPGASP
jgi:glucan biosynthesis protein C